MKPIWNGLLCLPSCSAIELKRSKILRPVSFDRETFEFYIRTLKRLAPDATWTGAGIGKDQITLNEWSLELGGHCRTGLEDNVRIDRVTLAPSNAALVERVVERCGRYGRRPATVQEARTLLKLVA